MVNLTTTDWTEIYYALETKKNTVVAYKGWVSHLNKIMDAIGVDGKKAAEKGVEANRSDQQKKERD